MKNKAKSKVLVSETLLMFLVEWLEWATGNEQDIRMDVKFKRHCGLCTLFELWCRRTEREYDSYALYNAFIASHLDDIYPFGEENFDRRTENYTQHLDPARLAWVRKIIKDNRGPKNV